MGASEQCIATHPSDMCVTLVALDAVVRLQGATKERQIPIGEFHCLPGDTPHIETVLEPGELITAIDLPSPLTTRAHYLKVRDRASYAFALVSVAVAVDIDGNQINTARIALGGVASKPWRVAAEEILMRGSVNEETFQRAAQATVRDAKPQKYNAFRVEMVKRAIIRSLTIAAEET